MAIRKLHAWVAVIGIGLVSAAAWWWQQQPAKGVTPTGDGKSAAATPAKPGAAKGGAPGAGGPGAGGGGPVIVEVGKVEVMRVEDDTQAIGATKSAQSVILRPEVSGRVARLTFTDGQRVTRGQLLVQLDDALQQAQVQQANAQAAIARTNLQRSRELQGQGFVSQSAVDQNAASVQVADAQVALAQAQLARMKIIAPFDGVAGIRSVSVGDYLKDGADIVNIEDLSSLWVDFRLPERFAGRIKVGQDVQVSLDALPGKVSSAKVAAIDSVVDAAGRSLLVRARMANPGGTLKTGMFARTRVVLGARETALVVPEEALVPMGGKQFLVKIIDGPDGKKMSQRLEAKLGLRLLGKVEIREGLAAGDLVVTAGHARLLRGESMPVRIVEVGKASGAGANAPAGTPAGAGGKGEAKPAAPAASAPARAAAPA